VDSSSPSATRTPRPGVTLSLTALSCLPADPLSPEGAPIDVSEEKRETPATLFAFHQANKRMNLKHPEGYLCPGSPDAAELARPRRSIDLTLKISTTGHALWHSRTAGWSGPNTYSTDQRSRKTG
jgi:hypothetical protein